MIIDTLPRAETALRQESIGRRIVPDNYLIVSGRIPFLSETGSALSFQIPYALYYNTNQHGKGGTMAADKQKKKEGEILN